MKGTIFAVALNHQSQQEAGLRRLKSPLQHAAKNAGVVYQTAQHGDSRGRAHSFPAGETVLSGATVALVVGKTASRVRVEDAAAYIAGYALANEVSLPEELLPPGH